MKKKVASVPSNEKIRIKKNYKPKANDKGKENNTSFFEIWLSL